MFGNSRPLNHNTQKQTHTQRREHMSDQTTETIELFDDVPETFPSKFHLKDRLVAVWVTGKHGERKNSDGKPYPYEETITLVLDDGPNGWQEQVMNTDTGNMEANLVPSVADNGPQKLPNFQWSAGGIVTRLAPRREQKVSRPMLGRVNSQPNKTKGRNAPWNMANATTDEKQAAATTGGALIAEICAEVEKMLTGAADASDFD